MFLCITITFAFIFTSSPKYTLTLNLRELWQEIRPSFYSLKILIQFLLHISQKGTLFLPEYTGNVIYKCPCREWTGQYSVQNVGVIFFQKGMYIIRNENIIPDIFYNKECCNIFLIKCWVRETMGKIPESKCNTDFVSQYFMLFRIKFCKMRGGLRNGQ